MRGQFPKIRTLRLTLNLKFIIGCSATLITALGISFSIIAHHQEKLIMGQVENEARAIFRHTVITRKWISDHGGIFVEKLPWTKASPYLPNSEIHAKGKRYIKETPAMVTKELSKYARDKGAYWFHITSLKLTNPENAPDPLERKALLEFENKGKKEFLSIDTIDNSRYLRYIAPLYVEDTCLKCHAKQGYRIGDVRGAISVTVPVDRTFTEISANRKRMFVAALLTVVSLMAAMFLMMRNLVLTPMRKLKSSIEQFSDGTYNPESMLRTGDEFEDLCRTFSEMAGALTEYHNCLNDNIRAATQDIESTNRKLIEANRMLSEANVRKSDFIARASHELRTPLTAIKGAMDYISAKLSSIPPEKTEGTPIDDLYIFFQVIKKNSERLIRMVSLMLDIERIEMGGAELQFSTVNLSCLIAETMASLQVNADEKGIALHASLPDSLPACVDEDRIRQVLVNLLSNAIKISPERSEITVNAFSEKGFIVTEVCDRGPGVPESEQEKIFEKFYKKGDREGAGLGLAICKSIIEAHNGAIGVAGNGMEGSRFYFKLPRTEGPQEDFSSKDSLETGQSKLLEIARNISLC